MGVGVMEVSRMVMGLDLATKELLDLLAFV